MRHLSVGVGRGLPALVLLAMVTAPRTAAARDRLAVVVVAEGEPELGDNLTEVALSSLARRGDHELVGGRELRARRVDIPVGPKLEACIAQPACLEHLGAASGAVRFVIGNIRRDDAGFTVEVALVETATGVKIAESTRIVPMNVPSLIAAVETDVSALFTAREPATSGSVPIPILRPFAPTPQSSQPRVLLDVGADGARAGRRHQTGARAGYAGAAAAGLAVVAFAAAAITGSVAEAPLVGGTRPEMQADLRRRQGYATVANALLIAGGVLSLTATALLAWWWRGASAGNREPEP